VQCEIHIAHLNTVGVHVLVFGSNVVDALELVGDPGQRVVHVFVQDIALRSWASARPPLALAATGSCTCPYRSCSRGQERNSKSIP
jgi:hypothetical protein